MEKLKILVDSGQTIPVGQTHNPENQTNQSSVSDSSIGDKLDLLLKETQEQGKELRQEIHRMDNSIVNAEENIEETQKSIEHIRKALGLIPNTKEVTSPQAPDKKIEAVVEKAREPELEVVYEDILSISGELRFTENKKKKVTLAKELSKYINDQGKVYGNEKVNKLAEEAISPLIGSAFWEEVGGLQGSHFEASLEKAKTDLDKTMGYGHYLASGEFNNSSKESSDKKIGFFNKLLSRIGVNKEPENKGHAFDALLPFVSEEKAKEVLESRLKKFVQDKVSNITLSEQIVDHKDKVLKEDQDRKRGVLSVDDMINMQSLLVKTLSKMEDAIGKESIEDIFRESILPTAVSNVTIKNKIDMSSAMIEIERWDNVFPNLGLQKILSENLMKSGVVDDKRREDFFKARYEYQDDKEQNELSPLTQAYIEDMEKIEGLYPGNKDQEKEYKKTIIENISRVEKQLYPLYKLLAEKRGVSIDAIKETLQKKVENMVASSDIFRSTSISLLEKLVDGDGKFRTMFDYGTSGNPELTLQLRADTEKSLFGISNEPSTFKDTKELRPIYGYFSDNENGVINKKGSTEEVNATTAIGYGKLTLKFGKDGLDSRTTLMLSDTTEQLTDATCTPYNKSHFTSFPLLYSYLLGTEIGGILSTEGKSSRADWGPRHTETQSHGGLSLHNKVSIHVSKTNGMTDEEIRKTYGLVEHWNNKHPQSPINIVEY